MLFIIMNSVKYYYPIQMGVTFDITLYITLTTLFCRIIIIINIVIYLIII